MTDEKKLQTAAGSAVLLTLAAASIYGVGGGIRANYGILLGPVSEESGVPYASVSFALAVAQLSFGVMQPVFGAVAMKRSNALVLRLGAVLMTAGLALLPLCKSFWALLLLLGLLGTMAFLSAPSLLLMPCPCTSAVRRRGRPPRARSGGRGWRRWSARPSGAGTTPSCWRASSSAASIWPSSRPICTPRSPPTASRSGPPPTPSPPMARPRCWGRCSAAGCAGGPPWSASWPLSTPPGWG